MKNENLGYNDKLKIGFENFSDKLTELKLALKYQNTFFAFLAFLIPFITYIMTLQPKLVGGDTSWYSIQVPLMEILVPTGYPAFAIAGKLISLIPVFDLAYRLNLMSAIFGALTILFLFLSINRLTKNGIISLISSLTFAYTITFWSVSNRFELDTINSFFITLVLYTIFKYEEKKDRKHLYFCFAALGFLLTDHPVAFFVMPALLLFIIILNPKIFKNIKAVILSIIYFILPLSFYAWLPIRSIQGYGPVKTFRDFFLYVTGRNPTGEIVSGSILDKGWQFFLTTVVSSLKIIYTNFGIILLIVSLIGLYYSFKKNWKFSLCSLLLIFSNILIISLYSYGALENFLIDTLLIITLYIAMGFLFILETTRSFLIKILKIDKGKKLKSKILQNILIFIIILIFLCAPILMAGFNYREADASKIEGIYIFWSEIFNSIEKGSSIYVASTSANIGAFIDIFEQPEKEINYIRAGWPLYNKDNIKKELKEGKIVYFINVEESMVPFFNFEKIDSYRWPRFEENIVFYRLASEKLSLKIEYQISSKEIKFGEKFTVLYKIINENNKDLAITSLELKLPKNIIFLGVSKGEDITDSPGLRQAKYMWVKEYKIKANSQSSIGIELQAESPGEAVIKFAATSQNIYMNSEDLNIIVRN